jgi:catechol 2,3-dioxygenase-like lactoylglutathione lyase family enzyme
VEVEKHGIQGTWNRIQRVGCRRKRAGWAAVGILILAGLSFPGAQGADSPPEGPRITGLAHIAYYVTDLNRARGYYEGFLGFQEAFALKNPDGSDHAAFVKINDDQFIELIAEPPQNHGYMHDAGFETNDADGLRKHLASIGVKVPAKVARDAAGNLSFQITDPAGFTLEIVQYEPGSLTGRSRGKAMPATRISTKIDHIGLLEDSREAAWKFYGDAFGFEKEGDGSKMTIPGSSDRFEIGFERKTATIDRYHVKDHICLSVPDVPAVVAMLNAKPAAKNYRTIETHVLGNGKHVAELYGPDGNRIELMEPPK